jgi:peptidoglycan/xylan/chitin deacetylase (PgdA/CDA1 family)
MLSLKNTIYAVILISIVSTPLQASIKIVLTFDDGPANSIKHKPSSTGIVLDVLKKEHIKAAFFVLTAPDRFKAKTLHKAETREGLKLLKQIAYDGHLIACHWGGTYKSQKKLHPNRILLKAYDYNNDNIIDKVTSRGNALETDLLQCKSRIHEAVQAAGMQNISVRFVRPPLWKYKNFRGDARHTYNALKLKMILTDAKLYDGGGGLQMRRKLVRDLEKTIKSGETNIVLTMHDSIMRTAKKLHSTINFIRKRMTRLGLTEGKDWSFTKSRTEIEDIFNSKTTFYLYPEKK